jgi:uncharacterized OB-fold protein
MPEIIICEKCGTAIYNTEIICPYCGEILSYC